MDPGLDFNRIVSEYEGRIVRYLASLLEDPVLARDLAQEAFLRAYRGLDGFKGDARFSTWLYRITWNLCADWLRRNRKPGRAPLAIDDAAGVADGRVDLEEGFLAAEEQRPCCDATN